MSDSNNTENDLINQIIELKKKLSFMEIMRGKKFDSNELDLVNLKLELEKSRRASNIIEVRHNLIYNQPHIGIVYFDNDRIIIDCNNRFTEIVGLSEEAVIGHSIFNIFKDKEVLGSIKKALNGLSSAFEGSYFNSKTYTKLFISGHFINNSSKNGNESINVGIFEDITITKKTEYKFELLLHSFKNISECVVITDYENKINYVNDAFIKLYGYTETEILGKTIKILRSLNNSAKINEAVYTLGNKPESWQGTLLNVKKDGTEFPIFLSSATVKNSYGKSYARLGIIRDITNEKKIESELISAKTRAEQSDKLKSAFLGQMSHEIRTPINIILNISNMILEDHYIDADEDTLSTFAILDSAGKRIIRTIDLILNMSDIQVGAYKINLKQLDLFSEMYSSFNHEFRKKAEEKDLEFNWIKETENTFVNGDYYSLSQIFSNILHNAFQFTHIGEVEIVFRVNEDKNLVVDFVDTGIGISEEFLPNIFNAFAQEESGYTRRYEGNGLGLSLVKAYCDMSNIKIDIESKKGFGSTFSLTFLN